MEIEPERFAEFKKLAGESQLPAERAQAMLEFGLGELRKAQESQMRVWTETQTQWVDEVKADKEIGGTNLANVQATVARAFDQFGVKGVREALSFTGAGNNPAIVKTFYRMAKALTEGQHIGGQPPGGPKTAAQLLYPQKDN